MIASKTQPATEADLEQLDDTVVGEILGGELVVSPRPSGPHGLVASGAGFLLSGPFRYGVGGPGGWWILDEPQVHLAADVVVPDLGGWRRARMPEVPTDHRFRIPPDWVCEVLSPSTRRHDRLYKIDLFDRHRVPHVWLIDPVDRTLEVYARLADGGYRIQVIDAGASAAARVPPFDAVALDLTLLWK